MIILLNGKKEEVRNGSKYSVTFIKDRDRIEFAYYMGGGTYAF